MNSHGPGPAVVDSAAARIRAQSFLTTQPLKADSTSDIGSSPSSHQWKWLESFHRSLSYGTDDGAEDGAAAAASPPLEMSAEDREALDHLLSLEGMSERGAAMRRALSELATCLESIKDASPEDAGSDPARDDRMMELLFTVRDSVQDRVDFQRAFVAVGGLDFLLGCASQRDAVSRRVRSACLVVLSRLALGNVSVQLRLLDMGAVRTLSSLYFAEFPSEDSPRDYEDEDGTLRAQIIQAMDAAVCGHAAAERRFCSDRRGPRVVECGLGMPHGLAPTLPDDSPEGTAATVPPAALRRRCLSFLRELATSRFASSDPARVRALGPAVAHAGRVMTDPATEPDGRAREAALGLVLRVLRLGGPAAESVSAIKSEMTEIGGRRVAEIGKMDAVEREVSGDMELDLWVRLTAELEKLP